MLAKLDQFIFSEDVQLGDVTATFAQMAAVGPAAARRRGAATCRRRTPLMPKTATSDGSGRRAGDRRAHHRHRRTGLRPVRRSLAGRCAGRRCGPPAPSKPTRGPRRHASRRGPALSSTWPTTRFRSKRASSPAPSASKGCYVGQEVIIRVLHRGHGRVARKLVALHGGRRWSFSLPPAAPSAAAIARSARHEQHAVAGAPADRSRSATSTAIS